MSKRKESKMGRGFFKETLKSGEKKTAAEGATAAVVVFDDVTVCCYLKCRRRVLAAARKASARGKDWECVNGQAGMTKAWIDEYALKSGIVPNFSVELKPIAAGTKVVSVKCIGGHPSRTVLIVETIADAKRCFARVRNLDEYPISLGEVFDCIDVNGHLEWVNKYNSVKY
jgi:hypothetical protein